VPTSCPIDFPAFAATQQVCLQSVRDAAVVLLLGWRWRPIRHHATPGPRPGYPVVSWSRYWLPKGSTKVTKRPPTLSNGAPWKLTPLAFHSW
jgi:hypothetical protein